MFRMQMPRLHELRDLISDPNSLDAYFQNFEKNVQGSPRHVKKIYLSWENELNGLDGNAWELLKSEASSYLIRKDRSGRGWQQLFDILNQARAYNYLKAIGCSDVRFIPRSDTRTPDLEGILDSVRTLCEVKTINISEEEARARREFTVRTIVTRLDGGFFRKLKSDLLQAMDQLRAYDTTNEARYFAYVNLCFDDFLGEFKREYFRQIDQYLSDNPIPGIAIVFHNDRMPFHEELAIANATVVNAG